MKSIIISGKTYAPIKSNEEIYAGAARIFKECLALDIMDEEKIREFLERSAATIDSWFGCQTMLEVSAGEPVSITTILKIVNCVIEQIAKNYAEYVAKEYADDE